jgi:Domain of unknown function (DUF2019)
MSGADFSGMDVDGIVEVYAAAAAHYYGATQHGDSHGANVAFETVSAAYRELRVRGIEAQHALLPLLAHENPAVRLAAGAHALEFAPEAGEPALTELTAEDETSVAFDAEMTLEVWRDGELRFP